MDFEQKSHLKNLVGTMFRTATILVKKMIIFKEDRQGKNFDLKLHLIVAS